MKTPQDTDAVKPVQTKEITAVAPAATCSASSVGGMSLEEAKEYLRRRNTETIFGRSWDEINRMQQKR